MPTTTSTGHVPEKIHDILQPGEVNCRRKMPGAPRGLEKRFCGLTTGCRALSFYLRVLTSIGHLLVAGLAVVLVGIAGHAGRIHWCSRQLETPIFQEGDLAGGGDKVLAILGDPTIRLQVRTESLTTDKSLRDLFCPPIWPRCVSGLSKYSSGSRGVSDRESGDSRSS